MSYSINKTKYLVQTEIVALEKALTFANTRDQLLVETALATGARATELLNIRAADLFHDDESVFIRALKGSNDRTIPLTHDLFSRLVKHANANGNQYLFSISYQRLDQIWRDIRPVQKKFHSLRHTFAIELYKKCRDLRIVQVALGHKSITNTMVYASYVTSTEDLRKAML